MRTVTGAPGTLTTSVLAWPSWRTLVIRSALRAAAALTLSAAAVLGLSGVASANDDVHQRCSDAVICTGSLLDVHNILPILSHIG